MTTSGTVAFNLDVVTIAEEAFERVGKEMRSGYELKTARRSLDLLMKEWANQGINFWTIEETTIAVDAGTNELTLASDTIDILDASWRTGSGMGQNDRIMTRMSVAEWAQTANKNQTSTPSRFWVNRTVPPVVTIWPIPSQAGIFVYWKMRLIEDVGNSSRTMDVPSRFLPAMVAGLAYYLAQKTPGAEAKISFLQQEYERQFRLAADEDRDRSSLFLVPGC